MRSFQYLDIPLADPKSGEAALRTIIFFSISWPFSGKFGGPTETKTEYTQNFSKIGINKSSFSLNGLFC